MRNHPGCKPDQTFAPDGTPITLATLPPRRLTRWTSRRKAMVVAAVQAGIIELDAACERYDLSVEEFLTWRAALRVGGFKALSVSNE